MSVAFAALRQKAVEIAAGELALGVRESNSYKAIADLHLPKDTILENRGQRVDEYLVVSGTERSMMNLAGSVGDSYRMWCGKFVYFCYKKASEVVGGQALPFRGPDLWSPYRLRTWAEGYDKWQLQVYNFVTANPLMWSGEMEEVRKEENAKKQEKVIVWDNTSHAIDIASVIVQPGDICCYGTVHMGMVSKGMEGTYFSTIEGNMSSVAEGTPSVKAVKRTVAECSLIVRI